MTNTALPPLPDRMWQWLCTHDDVRPEVVARAKSRLDRGDRPSAEALADVMLAWRSVVDRRVRAAHELHRGAS